MEIKFKNSGYNVPIPYERIALKIKNDGSLSAIVIDDTPEALKKAVDSGACAVSWFKFKMADDDNQSAIYEGDLIIHFNMTDPRHADQMTAEQRLLRPASAGFKLKSPFQQSETPQNIVNEILEFAKWLQKKYGFSGKDLKLLINKQWGWVGLIIPAGLLGTHEGGQALPAIYRRLGQRLVDGWRGTLLKSSDIIIEQSRRIFDCLQTRMAGAHPDATIRDDSLRVLSTIWVDLQGNQKLFDLDSFDAFSWQHVTHSNGDSADLILYKQTTSPKIQKTTKLAWELVSSAHQLLKKDHNFKIATENQFPPNPFHYLWQVQRHLAAGLHKIGEAFRPLIFYQCPAFSQMPTDTIILNDPAKPLDILKRDEINLLTFFKTGKLLDLTSSCQAIKKSFDCGHNCGIDSPFTLAFHPAINLKKKSIPAVVANFYERGGFLYYQKRRNKNLIEETPLCRALSTVALLKEGQPTGDILVRQGDTDIVTVVTSGELRPVNAGKLLDTLTRSNFQLESRDLKIVKLIQNYLRLPSPAQQELVTWAGWHGGDYGTLFFAHPSEEKIHPARISYIQQFPGHKHSFVFPHKQFGFEYSQTHPALFEISRIPDIATKEWSIFLICLALSSPLLPFAMFSGAGYFLWGHLAGNISRYIFSLIYGHSINNYWIAWPFELVKPSQLKDKAKVYKRSPYNKLDDFLDTYNQSFLLLGGAWNKPFDQIKRQGNFLALDKNRKQHQQSPLDNVPFWSLRKKAKRCLNFVTFFDDNYQPQAQNRPSGHLVNLDLGDIHYDLKPRFDGPPLMLKWLALLERDQVGLGNMGRDIIDFLSQFLRDVSLPKKQKTKLFTKLKIGFQKKTSLTPKEAVARRFALALFAGLKAESMGLFGDSLSQNEIISACKNRFKHWLAQPQTIPRDMTNNDIVANVRSTLRRCLSKLGMKSPEQEKMIGAHISHLTKRNPSRITQINCPGYWHEFDPDRGTATCIITSPFFRTLMPAALNLASFKMLLRRAGILLDKESRSFRIPLENKVVRGYLFNLKNLFD